MVARTPLDDGVRAVVEERLRSFPRVSVPPQDDLRHAAVAVAIVRGEGGHGAFLLTRRATGLRAHPGQWALPGGRVDEGESVQDAVLRELHEEVGLEIGLDDVLGLLDDYTTRSGFAITPVVVWAVDAGEPSPDPAEVTSVHRIPFSELEREDSPRYLDIPESDRPVVQVGIHEHWIHAPTAAVLLQFAEVVLAGRHTRVAHLEQPVWAWR